MRCHYIKDPKTGEKVLIPGCMNGAVHGKHACICRPPIQIRESNEYHNKAEDTAITLLQTLCNASGAEFEDEEMAVKIIAETLKKWDDEL